MPDFELYQEYSVDEILADTQSTTGKKLVGDAFIVGDRLFILYDRSKPKLDWELEESDISFPDEPDPFIWTWRCHPVSHLYKDRNPIWCSNILVFPLASKSRSLISLVNGSSKRRLKESAIPILLFIRYDGQAGYRYSGELFLHEVTYWAYETRFGPKEWGVLGRSFDRKIASNEQYYLRKKQWAFDLEPRLPEVRWFELTGWRWSLWLLHHGNKMTHFRTDADLIDYLDRFRDQSTISGYLTRYERDHLDFYFSGDQATLSYSQGAFNKYNHLACQPVNPAYTGDPDVRLDPTEFEDLYGCLEVWPAYAIFTREEVIEIMTAYIREGQLPQRWEWRPYEPGPDTPDPSTEEDI